MPILFQQKPGLVVYLTAGDPNLAATREIAIAAIDAGTDVIELGVPFSDPLADGPVIQRASERALLKGTRLSDVLALAGDIRTLRPQAGLVIFSYYNPVLHYGLERFCKDAAAVGVDGVLITDLIVEEADEYLAATSAAGLAPIFLAAPTSPDERLKAVAEHSKGFIYAISRTGITGTQQTLTGDATELVTRIRRWSTLPIAVGFGISNAEHFQTVGAFADAAVIGSAIVQLVEQHGSKDSPGEVARFIKGLREQVSALVR